MVAPNDFNACNPNIFPSSAGVGFHSDRGSVVGVGDRRDVIRTLSVVMFSSLLLVYTCVQIILKRTRERHIY